MDQETNDKKPRQAVQMLDSHVATRSTSDSLGWVKLPLEMITIFYGKHTKNYGKTMGNMVNIQKTMENHHFF